MDKTGPTLNARQLAFLRVSICIVALMILFPPYVNRGGLFGGVQFAFILRPPAADYRIDYRPAIAAESLQLQLSAVVSLTAAAICAHDAKAGSRRRSIFALSIFSAAVFATSSAVFSAVQPGRGWTEAPFLLCMIPLQFPGGYFLFWLRMAVFACMALFAVIAADRRSKPALGYGPFALILATNLGFLTLAILDAARR